MFSFHIYEYPRISNVLYGEDVEGNFAKMFFKKNQKILKFSDGFTYTFSIE